MAPCNYSIQPCGAIAGEVIVAKKIRGVERKKHVGAWEALIDIF